jgi:hypothetical protein
LQLVNGGAGQHKGRSIKKLVIHAKAVASQLPGCPAARLHRLADAGFVFGPVDEGQAAFQLFDWDRAEDAAVARQANHPEQVGFVVIAGFANGDQIAMYNVIGGIMALVAENPRAAAG